MRPQNLEKWRNSREPLVWQKPLKAQRGTPSGSVGPQDALEMIKKYKEK